MMMAETTSTRPANKGALSFARQALAQLDIEMGSADPTDHAYNVTGTAWPTSSTADLLKEAMASLEPLCGRLCEHAGQPGFSLGVEWDEIEKLRVMCETVLRFTSGDEVEHGENEAAATAERAQEQHVAQAATAAKNREQAAAAAAEKARKELEERKRKDRLKAAAARAAKAAAVIGSLMEAEGTAALKAAVAEAEPLGDEFPAVAEALEEAVERLRLAEGHGDMALPPTMGTKDAMSDVGDFRPLFVRGRGADPYPPMGTMPSPMPSQGRMPSSEGASPNALPTPPADTGGLFASSIRRSRSLEAQDVSQSVPTRSPTQSSPEALARARAARGRDLKAQQVQRASSMTPDARYTAPPNESDFVARRGSTTPPDDVAAQRVEKILWPPWPRM